MSPEEVIKDHAKLAFDEIKEALGDKWDNLSDDYKDSAKRAAERLVKLEWKKRVQGEDVDEDIKFVKTTVDEFKMAGEIMLYDAFWKGVDRALQALGSFLVGAGKSLVPGLGPILEGIKLGELLNE